MTDSPATRQSLLVRLRDPRDGQAWSEFVAIYTPLIDRLARANGLQSADAADLAQEVFRAVAGAIDRYDPDPARGSFRGWLFRIARNLMINLLAARRIRPQATGDSDVQDLLERVPAPDGAETAFFDLEYRRGLFVWAADQVRGEFRPSTWQAFWLTAVEGQDRECRGAGERHLDRGGVYRPQPGDGPAQVDHRTGRRRIRFLAMRTNTGRYHMASRPDECDRNRLRLSLEDRLSEVAASRAGGPPGGMPRLSPGSSSRWPPPANTGVTRPCSAASPLRSASPTIGIVREGSESSKRG